MKFRKAFLLASALLTAAPLFAGSPGEVAFRLCLFSGQREAPDAAGRFPFAAPSVVLLPPGSGWDADLARQRRQVQESLNLPRLIISGLKTTVARVGEDRRVEFDLSREPATPQDLTVTIHPGSFANGRADFDVTIGSRDKRSGTRTRLSALAGTSAIVGPGEKEGAVFLSVTPYAPDALPSDALGVAGSPDIGMPRRVGFVEPKYPPEERQAGRGGNVVLQALVRADGSVGDVAVVQGQTRAIDAAAMDAVRQWRYEPARMDGRAVPVYISFVVRFVPPVKGD